MVDIEWKARVLIQEILEEKPPPKRAYLCKFKMCIVRSQPFAQEERGRRGNQLDDKVKGVRLRKKFWIMMWVIGKKIKLSLKCL